ncbi:hypothetical protein ABPG72_008897 [Tetrahymena utriculariae]
MERIVESKPRLVIENIKANIFSTVFLIILGALLLLTYYLLKDYLTVLCFSFISAIAIKPTKNYILNWIISGRKNKSKNNILQENYLVQLFTGLYLLVTDFKNKYMGVWELIVDVLNSVKNFRTDIFSLLRLTLTYILVAKVGIALSFVSIGSLLLFDLLIRLFIYTYRHIFKAYIQENSEVDTAAQVIIDEQDQQNHQNSGKKGKKSPVKNQQQQVVVENEEAKQKRLKAEQEEEQFYNSLVSTLCVAGFVISIIFILVFFGGLCFWDIIDIRNKASQTLQIQLKEMNNLIEQQGIKSYLDEQFIKDQILSQVDKLDTYMSQSNLLPAIQVFQGVVNNYFNNTNSTLEEQEATYKFRLNIEQCQQGYIKYLNNSYIPQFIISSANEVTAVVCYIQIFIKQMDFNINEILNNLKNVGGNLYQNIQKIIIWIIQSMFTFLFSIIDYLLQTIIYLTSLFYLLSSPQFSLNKLLLLLPLEGEIKKKLEFSLEKNIRGVFASNLKISFYHIILTWLMLDIFDLPFSFITSVLAGILAIIPIIPVYFITIPYCIYLYFSGSILEMVILFVGYAHISLLSIDAIYSKNIAVHPFITGICVAMGLSVFELKGIIIGPLIVCSVYLLVDVLGEIQESKKIDLIKKGSLKKQNSNINTLKASSSQQQEASQAQTPEDQKNNQQKQKNKEAVESSEIKKETTSSETHQSRVNPKQQQQQLLNPNENQVTKRNTRTRSNKNNN